MTLPRPTRVFLAEDILTGRVDLSSYPFRYIRLLSHWQVHLFTNVTFAEVANRIDVVYTCVELLETRGWELVQFEMGGQGAHLRRVQ